MSQDQTTKTEDDGFREARFVYLGRRLGKGGKVAYALHKIGEVGSTSELWYAQSPKVGVGSIFTAEALEDGDRMSIRFATVRYVEPYPERELASIWRAKDLAAEAELSRKSVNTKSQRTDPLEEILEPLGELAKKLTRSERRALAVRILEVLG